MIDRWVSPLFADVHEPAIAGQRWVRRSLAA